jgi:hypothetical protein
LYKKSRGCGFSIPDYNDPEDRIDNSIDAGRVGEDDHGPGAPAHLHEALFNGMGGADG